MADVAPKSDDFPAPPTAAERRVAFDIIARMVYDLYPNTLRMRIEVDTSDGDKGFLPIPLRGGIPDDLAEAIIATLAKLKKGEWLGGQALATEVDCDRYDGSFNRAVGKLRQSDRIESDRKHGYRLK